MNSLLLTDGYKTGHHQQYPEGTTLVYSNFTPRSLNHAPKGCEKVLSFGQSYVVQWIVNHFQENFFNRPKEEVCQEMKRELSLYLNTDYDVSHFEALHDLGFLPVHIKALPEGVEVPIRVPVLTIRNTIEEFYWVTNYLETILSALLWRPMTAATIALQYKRILSKWAHSTDQDNLAFVDFQAHDFSMRGMPGLDAVIGSSIGHAAVFSGSDSLPVIHAMREYYGAEGFVVGSVNATEHSVMCAGTKDDEIGTFQRLLETYPTGILSIVSDTWDLWKVITEFLPVLKEQILDRDGKVVIRPDSGDPVDIICGERVYIPHEFETDEEEELTTQQLESPKHKGVVELLWELFGGTVNEQGYKVLDSHIGVIYGDSITLERADQICRRLARKGFASTNVVLGIGSFTYQFNTRDTFGFAMKATYCEVNNEARPIFKDPATDEGSKKSAKGLLMVDEDMVLHEDCSWPEEDTGSLETIYHPSSAFRTPLALIKERINKIIENDLSS